MYAQFRSQPDMWQAGKIWVILFCLFLPKFPFSPVNIVALA